MTLTQERLRHLKREWEARAEVLDRFAILDASKINYDAWYYFNHKRLFEIAANIGVIFTELPAYGSAYAARTVDEVGMLRRRAGRSLYMYEGDDILILYHYVAQVMYSVIPHLRITNISDYLDRSTLPSILTPGDFVFVQGAHSFKSIDGRKSGVTQVYSGTRTVNHIELSYVFNRWEATSSSSWGCWLVGRQLVGSLVQLKNLERRHGKIVIQGTVFGISAPLQGVKKREYSPPPYQSGIWSFDEAEDDDWLDKRF